MIEVLMLMAKGMCLAFGAYVGWNLAKVVVDCMDLAFEQIFSKFKK